VAGISTDPDVLTAAAQGIGTAAEDMAGRLQGLSATVTTESPWGGDEPGTVFGTLYVAVLGHAMEAMSSHLDRLAYATSGLAGWAEQLAGTEQGVAGQLDAIHQLVAE
jgi:hypothetical protein